MAAAATIAAGALGLLGVSSRQVQASGAGYNLTVEYGRITRPGLATPWALRISRPGGFQSDTIMVSTTSSYFDIFDENGLEPEPLASVDDGESIIWTFSTPPGQDTIVVSLDGRIEPSVQLRRVRATTSIFDSGSPVATAAYETIVLP